MKKIWIAQWEVVPGDGIHTQQFSSFAAAERAMRQKIGEILDRELILSRLGRKEGAFLARYLSDPAYPRCPEDVPGDYEEPEHCSLYLSPSQIGWDYWVGACPRLHTNMVLTQPDEEDAEFHFWYEHPENLEGAPNLGLSIRIREKIQWGTSAYPLMILKVLDEKPRTQDDIVRAVREQFETEIDRKAVGRHLKMLQELGFFVRRNKHGYFIGK